MTEPALVVAYLQGIAYAERARVDQALAGNLSAADALRAIATSIVEVVRSPQFRGCAFLNAVAEYPNPEHPVHQAVVAHREWFLRTVTDLLARVGEASPDDAGRHFVMLRDGAMASGCLVDPAEVCDTFRRGVEGILRFRLDTDEFIGRLP